MNDPQRLVEQFEAHRRHLRHVAYRMLGSLSEADDAVQETWLRLSRSETDGVQNMGGWLTTIVARVSLDMLRSRKSRREEPLDALLSDPFVSRDDGTDPEYQAGIAGSVGHALIVVLETLTPAERLALVLHDVFALPFDEIAPIVERSRAAARQLASRARRRVQKAAPIHDADIAHQREIVEAFLAASRGGDLAALLAVLDPDVVLRVDRGASPLKIVRGARAVATQALAYSTLVQMAQRALVNGAVGVVSWLSGREPLSIMAITVARGKIIEMDVLADPARLRKLDLTML
jgi:RNA polymerase sigma-70 factor (ECF subfamily)